MFRKRQALPLVGPASAKTAPVPGAPGARGGRPRVVAQAAADGAPEAGSALLGGLDVEREAKEIEEQIKVHHNITR